MSAGTEVVLAAANSTGRAVERLVLNIFSQEDVDGDVFATFSRVTDKEKDRTSLHVLTLSLSLYFASEAMIGDFFRISVRQHRSLNQATCLVVYLVLPLEFWSEPQLFLGLLNREQSVIGTRGRVVLDTREGGLDKLVV